MKRIGLPTCASVFPMTFLMIPEEHRLLPGEPERQYLYCPDSVVFESVPVPCVLSDSCELLFLYFF